MILLIWRVMKKHFWHFKTVVKEGHDKASRGRVINKS